MKTVTPTPEQIKQDWYLVDASDQILGRLATRTPLPAPDHLRTNLLSTAPPLPHKKSPEILAGLGALSCSLRFVELTDLLRPRDPAG